MSDYPYYVRSNCNPIVEPVYGGFTKYSSIEIAVADAKYLCFACSPDKQQYIFKADSSCGEWKPPKYEFVMAVTITPEERMEYALAHSRE